MRGVTIGDVDRQRVEDAKLMGPPMGLPVLEPITMAQEDFSAKERKVGWIDDDIVDGVEGAGPPSERASEKMELEESKEAEEISETIEEADTRRSNIEGQSKAKTHVRGFSVVPKDL